MHGSGSTFAFESTLVRSPSTTDPLPVKRLPALFTTFLLGLSSGLSSGLGVPRAILMALGCAYGYKVRNIKLEQLYAPTPGMRAEQLKQNADGLFKRWLRFRPPTPLILPEALTLPHHSGRIRELEMNSQSLANDRVAHISGAHAVRTVDQPSTGGVIPNWVPIGSGHRFDRKDLFLAQLTPAPKSVQIPYATIPLAPSSYCSATFHEEPRFERANSSILLYL